VPVDQDVIDQLSGRTWFFVVPMRLATTTSSTTSRFVSTTGKFSSMQATPPPRRVQTLFGPDFFLPNDDGSIANGGLTVQFFEVAYIEFDYRGLVLQGIGISRPPVGLCHQRLQHIANRLGVAGRNTLNLN